MMADDDFELEGLEELRKRSGVSLELEGLDELRKRAVESQKTPPRTPSNAPQPTISRGGVPSPTPQQNNAPRADLSNVPVPSVPTVEESRMAEALKAEREARRRMNPSSARTIGEFFSASGNKLFTQLRDNAKRIWNGVVQGELSTYQFLDNVSTMISDATGVHKTLLFEELIAKQSELQYDVENDGIIDRLFTALGRSAMEIPKVATFAKVPLGLPAMGAVTAYKEGPVEMAKEAATWGLIGRVFHATAGLPKSDQLIITPSVMASLELAGGGSTEDAIVAGITGFVLSSMGPGGRDISLAQRLRDRIRENPRVQASVERWVKEKALKAGADPAKFIKETAETYMKENMGITRSTLEGAKTGRTEIATKDVNLLKRLDESLSDVLKLTSRQQQSMTTQQKLDAYIGKFDPKGQLTPEGRERIVQSVVRSMEVTQTKIGADIKSTNQRPQESVDASYRTSREVFDRARKSEKSAEVDVLRKARDAFVRNVVSVSGNLHRELLKQGGEAGRRAVDTHVAVQGAPNRADVQYNVYKKMVEGNLHLRDNRPFQEIVFHRANIERYRHRSGRKTPLLGKIDLSTSEESLIKLRQELGEERFSRLYEAADNHFAWMHQRVSAMRDAGLLSQKQMDKIVNEGYAPLTFIKTADPMRSITVGGETITIPSSGIQYPKRMDRDLMMEPREIARQIAARTTARIDRNRAVDALRDFAEAYPQNTLIRLPEVVRHTKKGKSRAQPPEGFVRVDGLIEGKQYPIFMNKAYADEFVKMSAPMSRSWANFLRIASGSAIVRPLATGYNPFFILTNFPRDMGHVWVTTSEYSPILPYYGLQALRDLMAVAPDTLRRKGRWLDYLEQGGGMSFLTHQGTTQFERGFLRDPVTARLEPRMARLKTVLGYANETSEVWVRLMLRERAIRNGKSPFEATQIARQYLDFSQGGLYSKGIDHFVPYFNAAIQGTRGVLRNWKEHPVEAAAKWSQLIALETLMEFANYSVNPDAAGQISYEEKAKNWIFTTPWSFQDYWGNNRYGYFRIRKDQSAIPFTGIGTMLAEKAIMDRDPPSGVMTFLKELSPIRPGQTIPSVDAIYSYMFNKDFWSNRDVWKGGNVLETEEIYQFGPGGRTPTNPLAVALGRTLGLSPARLEHSVGRFVPNNPYTQAVGWFMRKAIEGVTPYDMSRMTEEMLAEAPFVKQTFAWTHPFSSEVDDLEQGVKKANTPIVQMRMDLDEMYAMYRTNQLDGGLGTIRAWIGNLPPEFRESMHERLQGRVHVDEAFARAKSIDPTLSIGSKTWWVASRSESPEVRADVYFEKWRAGESRERAIMDRLAQRIPGYWTDRFNRRLNKLKSERGTITD